MDTTVKSVASGGHEAKPTILLKSFSGESWYKISFDSQTCSCPQFTTARG